MKPVFRYEDGVWPNVAALAFTVLGWPAGIALLGQANGWLNALGVLLVAHRLPGCTIHASHDDGVSWDTGTQIDSAIWVMGSMIEVEPDRVLYVYWDSFESSMRAQFIRVTPRGIVPEAR